WVRCSTISPIGWIIGYWRISPNSCDQKHKAYSNTKSEHSELSNLDGTHFSPPLVGKSGAKVKGISISCCFGSSVLNVRVVAMKSGLEGTSHLKERICVSLAFSLIPLMVSPLGAFR